MTVAGTVTTLVFALESETAAPPAGASPLKVTFPVDELPPTTAFGLKLSEIGTGAATVNVPVLVTPPAVAETTTSVDVATGVVVTVKVALVAPAATVTLAGTAATAG